MPKFTFTFNHKVKSIFAWPSAATTSVPCEIYPSHHAIRTFTKCFKMADGDMATWVHDDKLKEAMSRYVQQSLQRSEILDFLTRDFPQYPWSIQSLDRRLHHFEIYYDSNSVGIDDVTQAVENELKGSGQLLGYREIHKKIRQEYGPNVTRDKAYDVMYELDPEGLEVRGGVRAKKK